MSLNPNQYTLIDDIIIIHYDVNQPVDFNLINKTFTKIIFSNYFDLDSCKNTLNEMNFIEYSKWRGSIFNKSINLKENITFLHFGESFNQPFEMTETITHIIFGSSFNQPINITDSLYHLVLRDIYNQPIISSNNLIFLMIGYNFDYPIQLEKVKYLDINCNNEYIINNLPNTLEKIFLNRGFNLPLDNLPNQLKSIVISNTNYIHKFNNLPDSIEYIELPKTCENSLSDLSNLSDGTNKLNNLPKNLKEIKYY